MRFPTIKTYLNSEEIGGEPRKSLEGILEFIDKIENGSGIQQLHNIEDLKKFYENYGDVSFLMIDKANNSNSYHEDNMNYKCLKFLSEEKYKSEFYFGYYNILNYNKENDDTISFYPEIKKIITNSNETFPQFLVSIFLN